jgi:hypothetical protein
MTIPNKLLLQEPFTVIQTDWRRTSNPNSESLTSRRCHTPPNRRRCWRCTMTMHADRGLSPAFGECPGNTIFRMRRREIGIKLEGIPCSKLRCSKLGRGCAAIGIFPDGNLVSYS